MNKKFRPALDILIESINYIVIGYALLSTGLSFGGDPPCLLLMASFVWMTGCYMRKAESVTHKKWAAWLLLGVCCIALAAAGYWIWPPLQAQCSI